MPWQQSASTSHVAFCPEQVPSAKSQRSSVSSQTIEQQPICEPELQVSPVPRHSVFAGSSSHSPAVLQMFEQHSAFTVQSSDWTLQISPVHVPLLQLRSQQSVAFVHDAPSPRQIVAQRVTPVIPCTGSQRPLQHSLVGPGVQSTSGARHEFAGKQMSL